MNRLFLLWMGVVWLMVIGCSTTNGRMNHRSSPREALRKDRQALAALKVVYGEASYYGAKFHGKKTASGEVFNMYDLTAAHREWPFGTVCRVTNLSNGKTVQVRINDRGPFVENRIMDLSYGAARALGALESGVIRVKIEVLKFGKEK